VLPTGLPTGIVLRETDLDALCFILVLGRETLFVDVAVVVSLGLITGLARPAEFLFVSFGGISLSFVV
jgi:hypothetical protein